MLITILSIVLAWSVVGGALAIVDCDGAYDRHPKWLWFFIYGPSLWALVAYIGIHYSVIELTRIIERKLRK